jgi:outer membrane protein TolC
MKLIYFIFYITLFITFATAKEIKKEDLVSGLYSIKIGVFQEKKNIEKVKKKFHNLPVVIFVRKNRSHIYITNIATKAKAQTILRNRVRKNFHDAYILQNTSKHHIVPKSTAVKTFDSNKTSPLHSKENATQKPTLKQKKQKSSTKKVIDTNTTVVQTKDTILLKDAILLSLQRSQKILSLREKVIQQKYKVEEKRGAFLPNVTLYSTAGYNYIHTRADTESEDKYPTADAQLNITENLYAGGKQSAELKKEEAKLRSESASFRDKVEEETLKIIEAYLDLYYQERAIEIERQNIAQLKKILHIVEIKEKNGAASKGDLNDIRSKVENASSAFVKASSRYQNALSFYQYFLGEKGAQRKPAQGTFTFPSYSKKRLFEIFEKKNAKLQINRYKMEAQKFDYYARKAPFRPTLDLIITGKEKFSKGEIDPYHDEKASAVLSFNYNLYKGGADRAKLLGSKSKIAELQYKYTDILESTRYNLKQLFENIQSLDDTLLHTQKEVDANKKAVEAYWNAFTYGSQDITTLLLAQRALNRAQQDLLKDQKNYVLSHFKLLAQSGELLEYLHLEDFVKPEKM